MGLATNMRYGPFTIFNVGDTVFNLDVTGCQNVKVGNGESPTVFCHGTSQLTIACGQLSRHNHTSEQQDRQHKKIK